MYMYVYVHVRICIHSIYRTEFVFIYIYIYIDTSNIECILIDILSIPMTTQCENRFEQTPVPKQTPLFPTNKQQANNNK